MKQYTAEQYNRARPPGPWRHLAVIAVVTTAIILALRATGIGGG